MSTDRIAEWTARKFEGLSRTELKEAGALLGVNFGPQTSERVMRVKLCEKVGTMPTASDTESAPDTKPAPSPKKASPFDPKPNLTAQGEWGGKKHRVLIHQQNNEGSDNPQTYVRLFHECEPRDYAFGQEIVLSHPRYESLRLAETGKLIPRELKDAEGNLVKIEHYTTKAPRYPFQYLGVVPGTEHLPESLRDYWQRQAEKTNNFEGIPRRQLIMIRADLLGPATPAFYKDLTDQDILADILGFLNIDEYAEAA
jgi:hypothetical protein